MYNPLKYTDPSGHIPEIDDLELYKILKTESEKEELTYSEDRSVDGNSQSTGCPSEFPECSMFFDETLSSEEIEVWIQALESHKSRMVAGKWIAVGDLAFSLVAITVITGSTVTAEELGKILLIEAFKDTTGAVAQSVIEDFHTLQINQMDQLIDYLGQAYEFSKDNGGSVRIQAGIQSSHNWANNTYIQYEGNEVMTFNSPVVYFELAYPYINN
jgi:hypothetical protein